MKEMLLDILNKYLVIFPLEKKQLSRLREFLEKYSYKDIIDWNNFDGHIVASGFIYNQKTQKFLVLYHNDLKMFLYPGGHIDINDGSPLEAAMREVEEETGLRNWNILKLSENELIPIDIDIHIIERNERLNLPWHYHFDFRYLFLVDNTPDIKFDLKELNSYKWIDFEELRKNSNYGKIVDKIQELFKNGTLN